MPSYTEYALLCLENPLLDIQGEGDEAMLQQYGLKPNDAILAEEKHMGLYDDLLKNRNAKLLAGGAAQNTARGAQYILKPNSVVYIGCVGRDQYAETLKKACLDAGVKTMYRYDDEHPTGRCGVIITGKNRSMCTDLAAANHYKLEHLKSKEVWAAVEAAQIYYVGGYHLTVCPDAAYALGKHAAENDRAFVFGMGAPFIPAVFSQQLDTLLPFCDYILGNETEAIAYADKHNWEDKSITSIALDLAMMPKANQKRKRTVVITQGTDPTVVVVGNQGGEVEAKVFPVHAIAEKDIFDTNGAGDAFAGGFLAGLVKGRSLEECVDVGQWLARLGLTQLGPQYPMPKQTYQPEI